MKKVKCGRGQRIMEDGEGIHLEKIDKEGLSEEVTFEQRPEGWKGMRSFMVKRSAYKPRSRNEFGSWKQSRKISWLEQSERERGTGNELRSGRQAGPHRPD